MPDHNEAAELLRIHRCAIGLNSEEIEAIAEGSVVRHYQTGERAHAASDPVNSISLIISGLFELEIHADGSTKTFGNLGPHDQFGAASLIHEDNPAMDVIAAEPSIVVEMSMDNATQLMAEHRVFARNLLRNASANLTQIALGKGELSSLRRIAFLHVNSASRVISEKIQRRLSDLGEKLGRVVGRRGTAADPLSDWPTLSLDTQDSNEQSTAVRRQLADWSHLDRIIFDMDVQGMNREEHRLKSLLSFCQSVYLLADPASANKILPEIDRLLSEHSEWSRKLHLVWVLDEQSDVAPRLPQLEKHCKSVFKVKTAGSLDSLQHTDKPGIERVVHELRGVKIGLALAGGAARGMCHLGVLKAFEEYGILVDAIAGTSVGAMMGATYCAGYSPDDGIRRYTESLTPRGMFRLLGDKFYMVYKYRTKSWDRMLRPHFYDWKLEQLLIPLSTIAADLVMAEEYVRQTGDTVTGILESINLGAISVPICRDGMVLVDGGYLNNVPADTLVRQGADFVISVDISQSIEKRVGKNTADMPTARMKPPSIGQVLSRIREVAQKNLSLMGAAHADFVITPDVARVDLADFKSTPSTAEIGYQEAIKVMPELLSNLNRLDPQLFPLLDSID